MGKEGREGKDKVARSQVRMEGRKLEAKAGGR